VAIIELFSVLVNQSIQLSIVKLSNSVMSNQKTNKYATHTAHQNRATYINNDKLC